MTENHVMMQMWQSLLDDRKAARRVTYIKYGILGGLALLYAVGAAVAVKGDAVATPDSYAALVRINGAIGPGESASALTINPLLERAFADPAAKGVVLLVNSPGGTPVQSALIHDRIVGLKKQHNKKVVVVGEDLLASGAYMIAVAGDEIVVNRSTVAGSIGVVSRGFGFTGAMEKLGVERRVMTAGESKNQGDPFSPVTEEGTAKQTELLGQIHEHFIDTVKAGRGERLKLDTPGLFSGTVWTGEASVKYGLADKLGDIKSATQEAFGTNALKEYKPPQTFMDVVVSGLGSKLATELSVRFGNTVELKQP